MSEEREHPARDGTTADGGTTAAGRRPERGRYRILGEGAARVIVCGNHEELRLHVERGLTVTEAGRKKYPERTIFLDGVYGGAPFFDNKTRQYSLDHHQGCVRAFTLATCEQAVVMVLQGLPLDVGEWRVYINEPDLDAALAAWVLLNHAELLRDDEALLRHAMPLIRVEGVIDAHGLDKGVLSGLPHEVYEVERRRIDELLLEERSLKASSEWASVDFVTYTTQLLEALDAELFPSSHLDRLLQVEELRRVPLQGTRLAVLCRSNQGIYDVEAVLKERLEKQLGLIVLDLGGGRFTLRQVDPFLDQNLQALYPALNARDPRAAPGGESENVWGGAEDIGGSPRGTGSGLAGDEILRLAQQVYGGGEGWLGRIVKRLRT